jgi:ATPase subunit of ABC transporter with duplicated ATPase domains
VWLENFLLRFKNTVVLVSHDRHFLNKVCTHIADIDFGQISAYAGNYDFWRQSSELVQTLRGNQRKKNEEKAKELKAFIQRFSANASKSKQATSRQKQLEKLNLEDLPVSSRKHPFVHFQPEREAGKDVLTASGLRKLEGGEKILDNVSFTINKGDKVLFLAQNNLAIKTLFEILMEQETADGGSFKWGVTTTQSYFPSDNAKFFDCQDRNLVDWMRQYSPDQYENFIRGFLGKMLFTGDEALKKSNVLSGGERVRCMLARMMLSGANVLLLDGPTSHLDLESITAVNEGLIRYKGTVLFTSHDHEFTQTVANRVINLDDGPETNGKYTTYDAYMGFE